jgi:amino acid adenylation domain-containing protein
VIRREPETPCVSGAGAENLFYVLYTSGSTGRPKGVMIPHRSVANFVLWMQDAFPITAHDVVLQKTPYTFDISVWELCAPWLVGAKLVMARPEGHRDCRYLIDTIRDEGVTQLHVVPTLLQAMVEESGFGGCRALRRIFSAGEALPRALVKRVRERLDVGIVNLYGPTEANVDTYWVAGPDVPGEFAPIGRPIANTETYVLDEHLRPVPIGVPGEICVGGAGLARGYLRRPELTAERFITHPFSTVAGARLYRTGDRGRRLDDGNLEYLGRRDDQIKLRGVRIELGEIEAALREHPDVRDAAAVVRGDLPGEPRLAAYVVPRNGATATAGDIRRFLRAKLPEQMIPSAVASIGTLPLTSSGKVDRRRLPLVTSPAPTPACSPPRNPTEVQLVQIWESLLGVRPVGIDDGFFELGGHSLLAARLVAVVEREFGRKLPLSALVQDATVRHAAELLLHREADAFTRPATVISAAGARPPFIFLHGDFGGGGFYCHRLAQTLGADRPLAVLHPHGLDGRPVPPSIEEMAADHVATLRTLHPHGPYRLGGCNGGRVALEMARQVRAQGESVDLLVLLEASVFSGSLAARLLRVFARSLDRVPGLAPAARRRLIVRAGTDVLQFSRRIGYYRRRLERLVTEERAPRPAHGHGLRLGRAAAAMLQGLNSTPAAPDPVADSYIEAILRYRPRRYRGTITVVRAADGHDQRPDMGWGAVADSVESYVTPGSHLTCVTQHVSTLGAVLAARLEAADRRA